MRYVRPIIKQKLRFDVLSRDSFKCQYCGIADSTNSQLVIDHIVPVCDGGTNHILNLSSACIDCNSGKAGKRLSVKNMPEKLRKQLEELNSLGIKQEPIQFDEMYADAKIFEIIKPVTRDDKNELEEITNPVIRASSFPELKKVIPITSDEKDPILSQIYKLLVTRRKGRRRDPIKHSVGLIALSCITHKTFTFSLSSHGFNKLCELNHEVNKLDNKVGLFRKEENRFFDWAIESGFLIEINRASVDSKKSPRLIPKFYELSPPDLVKYIESGILNDLVKKRLRNITVALEEREFWRKINSRSNYIYDERDDYDKA